MSTVNYLVIAIILLSITNLLTMRLWYEDNKGFKDRISEYLSRSADIHGKSDGTD